MFAAVAKSYLGHIVTIKQKRDETQISDKTSVGAHGIWITSEIRNKKAVKKECRKITKIHLSDVV